MSQVATSLIEQTVQTNAQPGVGNKGGHICYHAKETTWYLGL